MHTILHLLIFFWYQIIWSGRVSQETAWLLQFLLLWTPSLEWTTLLCQTLGNPFSFQKQPQPLHFLISSNFTVEILLYICPFFLITTSSLTSPPPPLHTHTHISHWVCAGVPLLLLSKDLVQVLAPALQNEHRHQHCMYILEKEMTRSAKLQLNGNDDRFYITLFSALEHSLHSLSHVILNEWLLLFVVFFFFF